MCVGVPIARTGQQIYKADETRVTPNSDGLVVLERDAEEVFRPEAIASAWGKPITNDHPPRPEDENQKWPIIPLNWKDYAVGVTLNPRRGSGQEQDWLLADLLICDEEAIAAIDEGKVEISCGYGSEEEEIAPGHGRQVGILINHIALVDEGRCGRVCTIHDNNSLGEIIMKKFKSVKDAIKQAFTKRDERGLTTVLDSICDEAPIEVGRNPDAHEDDDKELKEMRDTLASLQEKVGKHDTAIAHHDSLHTGHTDMLQKHDAMLTKHDEAIKKMEGVDDPEAVEMDEMKEEVPQIHHDRIRTVKDSTLLQDAYQIVAAGAEILAPGIPVFKFDSAIKADRTFRDICSLRKRSLTLAARNVSDGTSGMFMEVSGGRLFSDAEIEKMPCRQTKILFDSLVSMKKRSNNNHSEQHVTAPSGQVKILSIADLNKSHRELHSKQ